MAKIPEFQPGTKGVSGPGPVLQDPGAATASSDRRFKAFQKLDQYADNMIEKREKSHLNDMLANTLIESEIDYLQTYEQGLKDYQNKPGEFGDYLKTEYEKKRNERLANLPGRVRDAAEEQLLKKEVSYRTRGITWQHNRQVDIEEQNFRTREQGYLTAAANTTSILDADRYVDEHRQAIESAEFMPDEMKAKRLDEVQGKIYGTVLEAQIAKDPASALRQLNIGAWDGKIDDVQKYKAINTAQRRVQSLQRESRVRLTEEKKDALAYTGSTGKMPWVMIERVRRTEGDDPANEFIDALKEAKETYDTVDMARTMTPAERQEEALLMQQELEESGSDDFRVRQNRFEKFVTASNKLNESLLRDPVAYSMEASPRPLRTPQERLDFQRMQGLEEHQLRLMDNATAKGLAERVKATRDPADVVDMLQGIRQEVGEKYYRYAMNDMIAGGMPRGLAITGSMHPVLDAGPQRLSATASRDGMKEIRQEIEAADRATIGERVRGELEDYFLSNQSSDPLERVAFADHVTDMAMVAMYQGEQMDDAVRKATSFVTRRYEYRNAMRIPKEYLERDLVDAGQVKRALDAEIGKLQENMGVTFALPAGTPESAYRDLLENARWMTNPGDDSVTLYDAFGPVMVMDGDKQKPVTLPWDKVTKRIRGQEEQQESSRTYRQELPANPTMMMMDY